MNKSKSVNKIILILLLTAMFFGIAFNIFSNKKHVLDETGAYLTSQGGLTGIIQLGGEKLSVTQNGEETSTIYFNVEYFVTDKKYEYNIGIKNTEKAGGSDSKYLRWKWTAVIDGVEENINKYVTPVKSGSKQAYAMGNWFYLVDNDYVATKLAPQEELNILTELRFNGEYDIETEKYGSLLDKYYSGSNIQIYLTVQGSTDDGNEEDKWAIETPQAIIYDHEGNELVRTNTFGEYTIPTDIAVTKNIVQDGATIYFQGFQIVNAETGNDGGSIFYPGDTIALGKYDRLVPVYAEEIDYGSTILYGIDDTTGTYVVKGVNGGSASGGNSTVTSIEIPTLIEGNVISTIYDLGFFKYIKLERVTLGQRVTTIGYGAFGYCTSLTDITIPESVTTIGDNAFYGCSSLASINLPSSVTSIGNYAFAESGLSSIAIPSGVTAIGDGMFGMCAGLTSVTLPSTVKTIGAQAFFGCTNLASINIPDGVNTIAEYAFQYCSSLISITLPGSLTNIGEQTFREAGLTYVTVEYGVTSISAGMFYDCKNLRNINLANSVVTIGDSAFYGCTSLVEITIPTSVTSIRPYVFKNCTALVNVYFANKVGWKAGSKVFTETELENSSQCAVYLTSSYYSSAWTRT